MWSGGTRSKSVHGWFKTAKTWKDVHNSWLYIMDFHGFPWLFAKHLSKVQVSCGLVWHRHRLLPLCTLSPTRIKASPIIPDAWPLHRLCFGVFFVSPEDKYELVMNYYNSIHHVNENYILDLKVGSRFSSCSSQCRRQRRSQKSNCQIAAQYRVLMHNHTTRIQLSCRSWSLLWLTSLHPSQLKHHSSPSEHFTHHWHISNVL